MCENSHGILLGFFTDTEPIEIRWIDRQMGDGGSEVPPVSHLKAGYPAMPVASFCTPEPYNQGSWSVHCWRPEKQGVTWWEPQHPNIGEWSSGAYASQVEVTHRGCAFAVSLFSLDLLFTVVVPAQNKGRSPLSSLTGKSSWGASKSFLCKNMSIHKVFRFSSFLIEVFVLKETIHLIRIPEFRVAYAVCHLHIWWIFIVNVIILCLFSFL